MSGVPIERWTAADKERFAEHAAPEAVEGVLREALARKRSVEHGIAWLEVLLVRRCREVASGDWPSISDQSTTEV